jgi:hypothetical protein
MDRDVWVLLLAAIDRAVRAAGRPPRRPTYSDRLVVRMYFWAVGHDRPPSWAAGREHYGPLCRPRKLPGVSQFNRRLADPRTQRILQRVHDALAAAAAAAAAGPPSPVHTLDGKALTVSPVSKDRDAAARGKVCGGYARGYKR